MRRLKILLVSFSIILLLPAAQAFAGGPAWGAKGFSNTHSTQNTAPTSIKNISTGKTYKTIQSAIDSANDNETIQLGDGDFYIDTELYIMNKKGLTLKGKGPDKTRVLVNSRTTLVIWAEYSEDLTISDVYLTHNVPPDDGPSCSAGVVQAFEVEDFTIENAELVGSGLLGVWYFAYGENGSLGTFTIKDSLIHENQQSGIIIEGTAFDMLVLDNVQVIGNYGSAMEVYGDPELLEDIRIVAADNLFFGNAMGHFSGDAPDSFKQEIIDSFVEGSDPVYEEDPAGSVYGGQNYGVYVPSNWEQDLTIEEIAKKHKVDANELAKLVAENDTVTVLPEYKDTPEILALKMRQLSYINGFRVKHGVGAIEFDIAVSRLASMHAYDQVLNGYMAHNSQSGETPWERAERYGIGIWAENIAMPGGVGDCDNFVPHVMLERMNTSTDLFMEEGPGGGHHDNMLADHHTGVGFGIMCYNGAVMYVEDFR